MNTRIAFFIFLTLSVTIFPYYIIYLQSDFLSSIIPGWNTDIVGIKIVSNLIKFVILGIITFHYWKLSKLTKEISYKKFLIHFGLTFSGVLLGKINLYDLLNFNTVNPEDIIHQIQIVVYIHVFMNILFFVGQILFWIFYVKFLKNN